MGKRKRKKRKPIDINGGGISTRHELINNFARAHDVAYDDAKRIIQEKPTKMTPHHKKTALIESVEAEYGSLSGFRKALTNTCEI